MGDSLLPPGDDSCRAGSTLPSSVGGRFPGSRGSGLGRASVLSEISGRWGRHGLLKQPCCSPCRTLEPLDTEGAARSMLSSFLPPVTSLPTEAPEHFPLRKTGERGRPWQAWRRRRALDLGQEYGVEGGLGPSSPHTHTHTPHLTPPPALPFFFLTHRGGWEGN